MKRKLRIGALISGTGTNLKAIMEACDAGKIDGEVVVVGSDKPGVKGLERAEKAGIPTFTVKYIPHKEAKELLKDGTGILEARKIVPEGWVEEFFSHLTNSGVAASMVNAIAEIELLKKIKPFEIDLLVLAGYMRILSPYFIDNFSPHPLNPKIMNIHPAILPSFKGENGYEDTFNYGCKVGGCTVHFVDYGEDTGPIIGQRSFAITLDDTLETVKEKGLKLEWKTYPQCIQLFAEGRLKIYKNSHDRVVVEILKKSRSFKKNCPQEN